MKFSKYEQTGLLILVATIFLGACSTVTHVTRTQAVPESANTPYEKILIIALFDSFDARAYLEKEVVIKLTALGVDSVASTTMMDSRTPVTRATFMTMVNDIGADAVLITQLTSLSTTGKVKDMRPEATYNIRPTYYYNVFSVDLQEYVEPQSVELQHELVLATEMYEVSSRKPVWGIEAQSKIVNDHEQVRDYNVFIDEADAIVSHLSMDGLIAQ